ncbi:MAG: AAA family ATPase [Flavobacteriales bacterium]|nr:AAA family ATPase [Flavobacteriales bacterium]
MGGGERGRSSPEVVHLKHILISMTSNIGSHIIQENFEGLERKDVDAVVEKTQREVMDLLRKTVRPEFLNRVDRYLSDEIIKFRPHASPKLSG